MSGPSFERRRSLWAKKKKTMKKKKRSKVMDYRRNEMYYKISFRSLFFFMFFHFFFISSRSDHNFIPVYWPKFTGKAEIKRNRPNLKNQSQFSESYDPTTVRMSPWFFPIELFLKLKKPQNWEVHSFSGRTV